MPTDAPALLLLADGAATKLTRYDTVKAALDAADTARLEQAAPTIAVYRCVAEWHQAPHYESHVHEELPR